MLSRAADAVYWMSRYAERAENIARFLDVSLQLMLDLPESHGDPWAGVIAATGDHETFAERNERPTRDAIVRFLTVDPDSPNSIVSCVREARDNARSIREAISSEMWEQVNTWYLRVREVAGSELVVDDPHDFLAAVKEASALFIGVTYLTMTHGEGWHFGRLGRLLERADQTSRIVDAKQVLLVASSPDVGASLEEIHLSALLRSVSALEMYRKSYGRLDHVSVLEFLMLNRLFPRSIRHCLSVAYESLRAITGRPSHVASTYPERLLGRLEADYEFAVVHEIVAEGVHEHVDIFQSKLNEVGLGIYGTFFAGRREPSTEEMRQEQDHADQ
jgi:uncharacterized alpha-E superfamily protein